MFCALEASAEITDKELFLQLYENYNKLVYSLAIEKLKSRTLAEECVQETFLVVTKKLSLLRGLNEEHRKNLICTIARGKAIDSIRKENIFEFIPEPKEFDIVTLESYESIDLANQIKKLSEREQTYIFLKFNYGFSNTEIAKTFKVSVSYVSRVINKSLEKIKIGLEEQQ